MRGCAGNVMFGKNDAGNMNLEFRKGVRLEIYHLEVIIEKAFKVKTLNKITWRMSAG